MPSWTGGAALLVPVLLALSIGLAACAGRRTADSAPADRILRVQRVVSLDPATPEDADAIAMRSGVIVAVGKFVDLARRHGGEDTAVEDLRPGVAVPGLVDAHCHLVAQGLQGLDLRGARSVAEVQERVAVAAGQAAPGEWIVGRGWDQNLWPEKRFPSRCDLDDAAPHHPVYLARVDGHAVWVNSLALERSGIDENTPEPAGGRIHRDPTTGTPTGILIDRAKELLRRPAPDRAARRRAILAAAAECHRFGLTGVHHAGVDGEVLELYRELYREGRLKLRIYAMIDGPGPLLEHYLRRGPEVGACDGRLTVRALKLYADGALGSRGAALLAPYSDRPEESGLLVTEPAELHRLTRRAAEAGLQVCVHAIGDRANRAVLDGFEAAIAATGRRDARHRVEHAQVLHPDDIPRFERLGVIASMQPTHLTSDMPWAMDRLGPERIQGAYAWRRLLASGAHLAGGSDFPVERVDPLLGLHAAITRRRTEEPGPGVYGPDQRMTPLEALRAFTAEAAYAAFEESIGGTLAPGKRADITVLAVDPLRVDPEALLGARVLATLVAGEVVYRAPPP
ncbi:MAG: amidohydrolase [Planctomycetes bacterium]|nr:amidohydrolase [Planctomycetota bacterium]